SRKVTSTGAAWQTPVGALQVVPPGQESACWHPETTLQESVVQATPSSHDSGTPPQAPPEQTSPVVQALPSLQAFALLVKTQPLPGLHESVVQALPSLQTSTVPGWHRPPEQDSTPLHRLPSSHSAEVV